MKRVFTDPAIKFFISILGLVVIFMVLKELQHIFIPLVIAYFLFFVFQPLNNFLQNHKMPLGAAVLVDLVIIIGFFWAISRVIIDSFSKFSDELPGYEQKLNHIVSSTALSLGITDSFLAEFNLSTILKDIDYGGLAGGFQDDVGSVCSRKISNFDDRCLLHGQ